MRKWIIRLGLGVVVLTGLAFAGLSYRMGSARDAYGMLRYALPRMGQGEVKVGDKAPDVELISTDGAGRLHLRDKIGARPLVLIFGSYT
jgi:hypothetical protein